MMSEKTAKETMFHVVQQGLASGMFKLLNQISIVQEAMQVLGIKAPEKPNSDKTGSGSGPQLRQYERPDGGTKTDSKRRV